MRFQVGRVDHHDPLLAAFGRQPLHHPGKDPHVAPPLPAIVEGLVRPILLGRIAPPQAIAVDEYYTAQHTPIIDPRTPMALRKKRFQPLHLLVCQPEKIAHRAPRQRGALNHAGAAASTQSMGPDPRENHCTHQNAQHEKTYLLHCGLTRFPTHGLQSRRYSDRPVLCESCSAPSSGANSPS